MSSQKFDAIVREALWIAHSKKCAYTHELLDLGSMQIDHVIPEKVAQSNDELAKVKASLGLAPDFDPFGLENLLPAKAGANLQKSDLTLNPSAAHFFLSIAAGKKAEVERNVDRIKKRLETGRAFIMLRQLLDAGVVQPADLASMLAGPPDEVFRLVASLDFADNTQVQSVSKAELDELRARPIKLGANDHLDGLTLGRDSGEETHVRTCLEYEAALQAGFYARNTYEIKMSAFFEQQCGLLSALARATLPTGSNISEPRVGLPDLHLLPFGLFPNIGEPSGPEAAIDHSSYQDKVNIGALRVKRVGSAVLNIEEPEGMGQYLAEVVRADFDGDGLEDMLVFEYCYATNGTLGFGGTRLLSRKSGQGIFEVSNL